MDPVTSASILSRLKEVSGEKREGQRKGIDTICRTMIRNLEAVVKLIEISGDLSINLLDTGAVNSILEPYCETNRDDGYQISHAAATIGMKTLTGSARIYSHPETGEEAVRIVTLFQFEREFISPELLPEVLEAFKQAVWWNGQFDMISVHREPGGPGIVRIEDGRWDISTAVRDNSIIITLT
ncbi:hypothetical protein AH06_66 [Erwinia phage AH06]|nr:hypothetical protein AH06_66 [Erwinia phage AH06]